ncbi:MAG: hypothetical protein OJI67_18060, partial [Prosthecobacter sp.]|nr:hypothetical protein [Prosthecobacter sp.]
IWGYENAPYQPSGELAISRNGRSLYSEKGKRNFYRNVNLQGRTLGPYLTFGAYTPLRYIEAPVEVRFFELGVYAF